MDESGPAHKKQFTVSLVLTPDQVFYGKGASIKKAQQSAADSALKETTLPKPRENVPKKVKKGKFFQEKKIIELLLSFDYIQRLRLVYLRDPQNPTVLLSYVAERLGLELKFIEELLPSKRIMMPRLPPPVPPPPLRPPHLPPLSLPMPIRLVYPQNPTVLLSYVAERLGLELKFIEELLPSKRIMMPRLAPPVPPPPLRPAHLPPLSLPMPPIVRSAFMPMMCERPIVRSAFMPMMCERFVYPPPRASFPPQCAPGSTSAPPVLPMHMIVSPTKALTLRPVPPPLVPGIDFTHQVRLELGKDFPEFIGRGMTMLGAEIQGAGSEISKSVVTVTRHGKPKSSISQIHECALYMRMNVEFLVVKEEGPAHDRHYVLRCSLISDDKVISADGEGSSKKIAKQNACSRMLEQLKSVESSPIFIAANVIKLQKKVGPPKELKRKTIIKVICDNDQRCEGTGPNKKLAKRAAAEAMLAKIGYVKPMPKPGKSLLKRRPNDVQQPVEIGKNSPAHHFHIFLSELLGNTTSQPCHVNQLKNALT
ncbi:unnamed protein product [Gongylonema pulchrum]|uniref:DRBM domain-containing protein n=1 Tax=Gongylonema pulchrum TaxID=637853 RepID=A0A183DY50_9BILA|nr:unnamed protein product [Gongylonema pulchrum]